MLIVLQEGILVFLLLLLLLQKVLPQIVNELIIKSNHVLFDPAIHWPLLL